MLGEKIGRVCVDGKQRIELTEDHHIACGGLRHVFQHPFRTDCVIKVMRPWVFGEPERIRGVPSPGRYFRLAHRTGAYKIFHREVAEYLAVRHRGGNQPRVMPELYGFVETNFRLGLVSEKICGANGGIAPTLRTIIARRAVTEALFPLLDDLFERLRALHVVVSDIHSGNIVLAVFDGLEHLVLIDGFGEKHAIPLRSFSKAINGLKLERIRQAVIMELRQVM